MRVFLLLFVLHRKVTFRFTFASHLVFADLNNLIKFIDEYGIEVGDPPNRRSFLLDKGTRWGGNVLKEFVGGIGGGIIGAFGGSWLAEEGAIHLIK